MTKSVFHIAAQIRAKQIATFNSQNRILKELSEHNDSEITSKQLVEFLESSLANSLEINNFLKTQDLNNVGYPIKFNKTALQLKMALDWAKQEDDQLIPNLQKGLLYHNLSNNLPSDELPTLASPNTEQYWGNENSSVSTVLLYSLSKLANLDVGSLPGAATFYPLYNSNFKFDDSLIPSTYNFANDSGMLLFGDYQYGAHRYFANQLAFGPEDCSSGVGKATGLSKSLVQTITTGVMHQAFTNPDNSFNYQPVVKLHSNTQGIELIEAGDIYLAKTHTAIIISKPDNQGNLVTLQFNRDIDSMQNKLLGGGQTTYNLIDTVKEMDVSILRSSNSGTIKEDFNLSEIINLIDQKYSEIVTDYSVEIHGDCSMFLDA